jgi:hypothetical protein
MREAHRSQVVQMGILHASGSASGFPLVTDRPIVRSATEAATEQRKRRYGTVQGLRPFDHFGKPRRAHKQPGARFLLHELDATVPQLRAADG